VLDWLAQVIRAMNKPLQLHVLGWGAQRVQAFTQQLRARGANVSGFVAPATTQPGTTQSVSGRITGIVSDPAVNAPGFKVQTSDPKMISLALLLPAVQKARP
jgi:hypothetical protein